MLLFLTINMVAVTSRANQQYKNTRKSGKRKASNDGIFPNTVAAYSFSSEDVNVSDLILGHPLFSPFSVVEIFGIIFQKIYKKPK